MVEQANWVTFDSDSDDALSLSDLPTSKPDNNNNNNNNNNPKDDTIGSPTKDDQFEFRIAAHNDQSSAKLVDMCAAEDVFLHGQLLPLSHSLDSSTSVSRSLSSNSCGSSSDARQSLLRIKSNTLYAYLSPNPRVKSSYRNGGGRRSISSLPPAGWGLLRLGVAMMPEMELSDMRLRLARGGSEKSRDKRGSKVWRLLGGGLMGCNCSPEDAISTNVLNGRKKGEGRRRIEGMMERRERMFEWLEELSLGKI